jgi:hypothetical protein
MNELRTTLWFPLPAPYGKNFRFCSTPVPKKGTTIMCEPVRKPLSNISVAGQARRLNLYQWTAADLAAGDFDLTSALAQWRDELITRLPARRPLKIRMPWIFVGALNRRSQWVVLCEGDAVYQFNLRTKTFEGLLVPRKDIPS